MNYLNSRCRGIEIFGSGNYHSSGLGDFELIEVTDRDELDDVFVEQPGVVETPRNETLDRSNESEITKEITLTPSSNYVVRFKQRVFSFPDTPPATPTKSGLGGNDSADLGSNSPKSIIQNHGNRLEYFKNVSVQSKRVANEHALGISGLDEEQHSTISTPITPELNRNLKFAQFGVNLQFGSPKTSRKITSSEVVECSTANEDVDGAILSESAKNGQLLTPHFSKTATTEFPPTPPLTPIKGSRTTLFQEITVISTEIVPFKKETKVLASESHITSLLASLHSPKPSCSGCTTFSINTSVFTAITKAFELSSHLPTTNPSFETHPALISHIIALVPTSPPTQCPTTETQTRLFASLNTHSISHINSSYAEIDFHTLHKYQAFRKEVFQISCSTNCGKHSNGFRVWNFSHVEGVNVGFGRKERVSARRVAAWRKGVLSRKIAYYSR